MAQRQWINFDCAATPSGRRALIVGALTLLAIVSGGCAGTFDAATAEPRAGRLISGRAAVVYSSRYEVDLGGLEKLHPFDIHKYGRMARQLVRSGHMTTADFFVPPEVTREQLLLVHTPDYLKSLGSPKIVAGYLESKPIKMLPAKSLDQGMLRAFRTSTGGTLVAARWAMACGLGINLGGGYHHAQPDRGEGFCIYADVPIAIRSLQAEGRIETALLVDLDVHQGNGNAICFQGDDSVFTFSIHEADIYPMPKARSDLDVELRPPVDDARYLAVLEAHLPRLLDNVEPDLVVLLGGVDVYDGDPLAHFELTAQGIVARDEYVVRQARDRGIPVLYVTSGGYSKVAWKIQYQSIANLLTTFARKPVPMMAAPAKVDAMVPKVMVKSKLKGK
jgi:histone deacetylase 11